MPSDRAAAPTPEQHLDRTSREPSCPRARNRYLRPRGPGRSSSVGAETGFLSLSSVTVLRLTPPRNSCRESAVGNSDVTRLYDENNAYYEPYQNGAFFTEYNIARRRHGNGVVCEGDDGLFTQSWYPICRSSEVPPGEVIGRGFLDGQVAVFRGESSEVSAVSAYCPHIGAHLARGQVVGDELECAFHRWTFDAAGQCTRTGCGDRVPPRSSLFKYPTVERYGLVWIFNGEDPQ